MSVIESLMTSKFIIVCLEENKMVRPPVSSYEIVGVWVVRMEVKNVNKLSSLVDDNLVFFILKCNELVGLDHCAENWLIVAHLFIEGSELTESQILIVKETPLPSAVMITIIISLSWEVDPLWMSELISHKVKICFTSQGLGQQTNHFMQRHSSWYSERWLTPSIHAMVNFSIE